MRADPKIRAVRKTFIDTVVFMLLQLSEVTFLLLAETENPP